MIGPALHRTLVGAATLMARARDPWWVITGAAVALHGVDVEADDVDILASRADARLLLGPSAVAGVPSDRFRSGVFGRLHCFPLPVEIMADFQLYAEGRWRPVRFATREMVKVGNALLPVPSRAELAALLAVLGRPKDLVRRRLLAS